MSGGLHDEFGVDDLTKRQHDLEEKLEESPIDIKALVTAGQRARRVINVLAVVVVFLVVVMVVQGFVIWRVNTLGRNAERAADKANVTANDVAKNSYTLHIACLTNNLFRLEDQKTWEKIFAYPSPVGLTQAQIAVRNEQIKDFKDFIEKKDAPQNCAVLAPIQPRSSSSTTTIGNP